MEKDTKFTLQKLYNQGDRIMIAVLWLHLLYAVALSGLYDTLSVALVIGVPAALVPTVLKLLMPGSRLTRSVIGASTMVFSALVIHQAHGMIEMHFGIFVLLAFLLYYRDWLPIVVAAAVIAVHHFTFNYLQMAGYGVYIFESHTGLDIVLVHAAYVVFETLILVYMALNIRKEAYQSEELHDIGGHLQVVDGMIDVTYRKENARSDFAQGFNQYMDAVHNVIKNASGAAHQMSTAAEELSYITAESARDVEEQLKEMDMTATAITEMSSASDEVARNASAAAEAARQADATSKSGTEIVGNTISGINRLAADVENASEAITRLEGETDKIGKVLDVIKDIAEQTNLLALNAAIEAARAGEQGRGFAVVADEVRTLASRTQVSTKEIEEMIAALQQGAESAVKVMATSRSQAQESVEEASRAGGSLEEIGAAIKSINDMTMMISGAAEEQNVVSGEVSRSVVASTDFTHRSSQNTAQIASSSEELSQLANNLNTLVARFKV